MKKTITLILAVIMAVSLFAGCGEKEVKNSLYNPDVKVGDTGGLKLPLTDKAEKVVWSVNSSNTNLNDSWMIKKYREMTGVDLELMILATATAGEKIKVLAASNQLPDIIGQGLEPEFADDLCIQGALAAVEDYLDVLPNFRKTFVDNKDNNWIFKSYAQSDGKLYGFFGWDWNRDINHGMLYRKDIFDKHGIKVWNSPETFYEALKKLKEIYPDSTPFVNKNGDALLNRLSTSWGIDAQNPYYDEATKIWKFSDTDPKYKEILDYVKKLFNEGLLDPEFVTTTQAQWTSKMTQKDKAFVTFDWIDRMVLFKEQTKDTVPGYDLRFAPPVGPNQSYPAVSQLCWAKYVSKNDKSELAFKLLDFTLSPTGKELMTMGIEGETYTLDENGMAIMKGFEDKRNVSGGDLQEKYGMRVEGMYVSFDRRCSYYQFSPEQQEAQDYVKDGKNTNPLDPVLVFTQEETSKKNDILGALQKSSLEFSTKYILNNGTDKDWENWLKSAEKLGYKDLEKIYNDAQKRYDAQ